MPAASASVSIVKENWTTDRSRIAFIVCTAATGTSGSIDQTA